MTAIKIPFTKKSIKEIPAKDLNAGSKGVELEIQTDFLVSQIHSLDGAHGGSITDGSFQKIAFVFQDNAEKAYYEALLDSKNQNFELSFDKEKVFLMVFGFGNLIDKTKPEVQLNLAYKSMIVFFESKFTGIIALESKGDKDTPNKDTPPNVSVVRNYCKSNDIKNLTYDEENDKLII
ncbi:7699_t:CDS:1, partial [Funneliformis geosporum]